MEKIRFFVSIFLLLSFGFTLGEEAFGKSEHVITCEAMASASYGLYQDICENQQPEKQSQDQKCNDPCHMGLCHFGHCSFLNASADLDYKSFELSNAKIPFSQTATDGPVLEGFRRPPRQS